MEKLTRWQKAYLVFLMIVGIFVWIVLYSIGERYSLSLSIPRSEEYNVALP